MTSSAGPAKVWLAGPSVAAVTWAPGRPTSPSGVWHARVPVASTHPHLVGRPGPRRRTDHQSRRRGPSWRVVHAGGARVVAAHRPGGLGRRVSPFLSINNHSSGPSCPECGVTVQCIGPPVAGCPCLIRIAPVVDGSLALDKESDGDALYPCSHSPGRPVAMRENGRRRG